MENRKLIALTCISGALAVALGAFGAHGLKPYLDETGMSNFQTANRYHFIHTLFALIVLTNVNFSHLARRIAIEVMAGILLFSGSLYFLALRSHFQWIPTWLGAITPIGGLLFIVAWIEGGIGILKKLKN